MKKKLEIWEISTPETRKLEKKKKAFRKEWDEVRETLTDIETDIKHVDDEILRLQRIQFAKGKKPKFKKGEILIRDMGTKPGEYLHRCNGRVKIMDDGVLSEYAGGFTYEIMYLTVLGLPAKKQPSESAWEDQLKKIDNL